MMDKIYYKIDPIEESDLFWTYYLKGANRKISKAVAESVLDNEYPETKVSIIKRLQRIYYAAGFVNVIVVCYDDRYEVSYD